MTYGKHCILAALVLLFPQRIPAQNATAEELFDDTVLHEIRLQINFNDWQTLQTTYLENTYYPASLKWRDRTAPSIGIRSRGLGSRSGVKPGLRIDFDRYEKDFKFLGLKSVVLDNATQDMSYMKERLSMAFFRRMGLPAPREAHAKLFINNEYAGLYTIVESVDKAFLRRTFGEDSGYLYEYKWNSAYNFENLGPDPGLYSPLPFKPETHENDPDPLPLAAFIQSVDRADDLNPYLDINGFVSYIAIENFLSEIDGITGYDGMNNFYLYRFSNTNRFQFLPWDKDVTFQTIDHPLDWNISNNALTRRILSAPEAQESYRAALTACSDQAAGWLEAEVDRIYQQIREAAHEDPKRAFSVEEFEAEVTHLRTFAQQRAGFVAQSLQ